MLIESIMTHHHICPNMYGFCNFRQKCYCNNIISVPVNCDVNKG